MRLSLATFFRNWDRRWEPFVTFPDCWRRCIRLSMDSVPCAETLVTCSQVRRGNLLGFDERRYDNEKAEWCIPYLVT